MKVQKKYITDVMYFYQKETEVNVVTAQHYDFKIVTKTKGHNIIAKSAYNARKTMFDELEQKNKYSHTSNKDHKGTVILLPDGAPSKYKEPAILLLQFLKN